MHHFGLIVSLFLLAAAMLECTGALALLATLAAAPIVLGVGLFVVDHFSPGARADRAARDGRIGEALLHYTRCGTDQQIAPLLAGTLPGWPDAQRALRGAFRELAALETMIRRARGVGVSAGLLDPLSREVVVAAGMLRRLADRLGVAGGAGCNSEEIENSFERAVARVDRIATALRAARFGLTELTLLDDRLAGDADHERTALRLRALGDAARELALLEERR
jgi:hypothetical protein